MAHGVVDTWARFSLTQYAEISVRGQMGLVLSGASTASQKTFLHDLSLAPNVFATSARLLDSESVPTVATAWQKSNLCALDPSSINRTLADGSLGCMTQAGRAPARTMVGARKSPRPTDLIRRMGMLCRDYGAPVSHLARGLHPASVEASQVGVSGHVSELDTALVPPCQGKRSVEPVTEPSLAVVANFGPARQVLPEYPKNLISTWNTVLRVRPSHHSLFGDMHGAEIEWRCGQKRVVGASSRSHTQGPVSWHAAINRQCIDHLPISCRMDCHCLFSKLNNSHHEPPCLESDSHQQR